MVRVYFVRLVWLIFEFFTIWRFRKQERLDFLYESGLAVGKGSNSDGFKSLETLPSTSSAAAATEPSSSKVLLHSLPLFRSSVCFGYLFVVLNYDLVAFFCCFCRKPPLYPELCLRISLILPMMLGGNFILILCLSFGSGSNKLLHA